MSRQIALAASILAAFVLAWFAERTPRPLPADAPATTEIYTCLDTLSLHDALPS